jgi:hypothetical protein
MKLLLGRQWPLPTQEKTRSRTWYCLLDFQDTHIFSKRLHSLPVKLFALLIDRTLETMKFSALIVLLLPVSAVAQHLERALAEVSEEDCDQRGTEK